MAVDEVMLGPPEGDLEAGVDQRDQIHGEPDLIAFHAKPPEQVTVTAQTFGHAERRTGDDPRIVQYVQPEMQAKTGRALGTPGCAIAYRL